MSEQDYTTPQPSSSPAPVQVELPISQPVVTYILLGINILIFLLTIVLGDQVAVLGIKNNQAIVDGQYYRLISAMFLHTELWHIGFNGYALYILGISLERFYGHTRFLVIYMLSGLAGSIASFALLPFNSLGASGAIFGIFAATIPFWYHNRFILGDFRRRIANIAWVIGINLVIGITSRGIDNWGHIGGLVGGLILGWFAAPRYVVGAMREGRLQIRDQSSAVVRWMAFGIFALLLILITTYLIVIRS